MDEEGDVMTTKKPKRERTKFERWMFENRVTWRGLADASGVSRTTLWAHGRNGDWPDDLRQKIVATLGKLGHVVTGKDLW